MHRFKLRVLLCTGLFCTPALAQSTDQNEPAKSPLGVWEAPVGHRQPSLADVPDQPTSTDDVIQQINRSLDSKLKGICRGC
jgi:hypothetical protein